MAETRRAAAARSVQPATLKRLTESAKIPEGTKRMLENTGKDSDFSKELQDALGFLRGLNREGHARDVADEFFGKLDEVAREASRLPMFEMMKKTK